MSIICDIHVKTRSINLYFSPLTSIQNTLITRIVSKYGSKEQQDKFLNILASEEIGSFCLSEAEAGSDAFDLKTTAKQIKISKNNREDSYSLEGTKLWISNAKEAGIFLVFANVNPKLGYKGITCFIFYKKETEGIKIGKKEKKVNEILSPSNHFIYFTVRIESFLYLSSYV